MRLHRREEQDQALADHVETVAYFDEQTGEFYEPPEPPLVYDPFGDEDSDLAG